MHRDGVNCRRDPAKLSPLQHSPFRQRGNSDRLDVHEDNLARVILALQAALASRASSREPRRRKIPTGVMACFQLSRRDAPGLASRLDKAAAAATAPPLQ